MGVDRQIGIHSSRFSSVAPTDGHHPLSPAPVAARPQASEWQIWTGLWIVYIVWGSTYLAIRVVVETVPPFLSAGGRFMLAGAAMLAFLAWRRGPSVLRPSRQQLLSCLAVGILLMGANAVVSFAEVDVPSSMAALLIGSVPLWVILYRRLLGDRVAAVSVAAVLVGFVGMAILLLPGKQTGGAPLLALLTCVAAAAMWAGGSVASTRLTLPRDPFVSGGWQMLLGGGVCVLTGALVGELGDFHPVRVQLPLADRVRLSGRLRILARVHRVRVAAAERARLEGRHIRVCEPCRGDRAGLGDPRRGRDGDDVRGRGGDRRLGRGGRAHRGAPLEFSLTSRRRTCGGSEGPAVTVGFIATMHARSSAGGLTLTPRSVPSRRAGHGERRY